MLKCSHCGGDCPDAYCEVFERDCLRMGCIHDRDREMPLIHAALAAKEKETMEKFLPLIENKLVSMSDEELAIWDEAYAELEQKMKECAAAGHPKTCYDGEPNLVCVCDVEKS